MGCIVRRGEIISPISGFGRIRSSFRRRLFLLSCQVSLVAEGGALFPLRRKRRSNTCGHLLSSLTRLGSLLSLPSLNGGGVFRHQMEDELRPTERPHSPTFFAAVCGKKRCLSDRRRWPFFLFFALHLLADWTERLPPAVANSVALHRRGGGGGGGGQLHSFGGDSTLLFPPLSLPSLDRRWRRRPLLPTPPPPRTPCFFPW